MDQSEHRLSHYVDALLDRIIEQPCWYTAVETGTVMVKATPQARMNAEAKRKARGIKPHHLDWYLFQAPRFVQIELKYGSNSMTQGQRDTCTLLARHQIPWGVCRSVIEVFAFLQAESFRLHGNAAGIAKEIEERWRAADAAPRAKTKARPRTKAPASRIREIEAIRSRTMF